MIYKEDNTGRLFQVKPNGTIVWEYVNRGGTTRPSVVPYDFTPQLRAMDRPEEKKGLLRPTILNGTFRQIENDVNGYS